MKLRLPGGYRREQYRLWQLINETDRWRLKPRPQREAMEREYQSYLDHIKDPELKKKLTPDYNLRCTRIPKSDKNYYEAVQLPNAGDIARIVPAAFTSPVDVISETPTPLSSRSASKSENPDPLLTRSGSRVPRYSLRGS